MEIQAIDILIVEDNKHDAELALNALKKSGIANTIFIVHDGEEALDFIYCRNAYSYRNIYFTPKLILLDLKLPKIDGLEVLRTIKQDENKKHIPVIVLTSSKLEIDLIESYKLGVNSYIHKPIDFDQFVESVKQIELYWLLLNKLPGITMNR